MKHLRFRILIAILVPFVFSCENEKTDLHNIDDLFIRIAEIEINSQFLEDYLIILKEESEASVRLESGVISIYPMFLKERPNQIRILEIYASEDAYKSHLETPHFKHYKTATLHMVTSLNLVEMESIDRQSMHKIFRKLNVIE